MAKSAVVAGESVTVSATVDDNRYRYNNAGQTTILPPPYPVVYNIASAKAYIDKLPWEAGAVGTALSLSVSAQAKADYPDATKVAAGAISTTGLSAGRHMVYVQGTNSDGKPGAVSAAFLDVAAAPVVEPVAESSGGGALGGTDVGLLLLGVLGLGVASRKPRDGSAR